jgi:hypothetical protein
MRWEDDMINGQSKMKVTNLDSQNIGETRGRMSKKAKIFIFIVEVSKDYNTKVV